MLNRATAQPRRELIFEDESGKQHIVPVPHAVKTVDALNEHLGWYGVLGPTWPKIVVYCPADDSEFLDLIEQRFGKIERVGAPDRNGYPTEVRATTLIPLPLEYHRAIAKIAFHFFIWSFAPPLTGFEASLDAIKQFIYRGLDAKRFVTSAVENIDRDENQFAAPWTHVLGAGWEGQEMVATVQLFAGSDLGMSFVAGSEGNRMFQIDPSKQALTWTVRLGRTELSYPFRKTLAFVGYPERRQGYDGEVRAIDSY